MPGICDTAIAAGNFKTLVIATQTAGLIPTLNTKGPFTVFAPNDEAFSKLPKGTIEELLKDKEKLTTILTYHVVSGEVSAAEAFKQKTLKTLQGQEITLNLETCTVNEANILQGDIAADNGYIHVIDKVLIPK
ncbi:MAG: fasciclin domain-containing protein [Candidatus Bathyarchaeia archaeon]|jgi:uncharacterized surface protein with fasciclin (FAS1) repeats